MRRLISTGCALLLLGVGGAILYGARRWRARTAAFVRRLEGFRAVPRVTFHDEKTIKGLPPPVARYFRAVLREGQPLIAGARLAQEGEFLRGDAGESWQPFVATQVFRASPPGFVWDARIRMAPGVPVHVRDAYVDRAGSMRGEIFGLVPVVDAHDTPEMAAGALQRYLAEAVWLPTALLPSPALEWTAIDESAARATLTDGQTTVSLEFRFSADGEIVSAFTPGRYHEVRDSFEPTPWACRYASYAEQDGMRIPMEGEVEWRIAGRPLPYWRGRITGVAYDFLR